MTSKVYITQDNRKNYTAANAYGTPVFVTALEYCGIQNSKNDLAIYSDINNMAAQFDCDNDFVLLSGDPVIIALICHTLLDLFGYLRLLKWDTQDRAYNVITINNQGIDNVNR